MIEKMKKRVIPAVSVTVFALLLSCGTMETIADAVQVGQETPGNAANTLPYDVSDIAKTVIMPGLLTDTDPIVTALKNGDTETLVGMAFGEPFDYELFEKAGWGYIDGADITFYRRKDRDEDLNYLFEGEGHRFSSLKTSSWEGRFFCLELGKDTRETVKDLFGNPDETGRAYIYHFEMADMLLKFEDGVLRGAEYSATEKAMAQNPVADAPTDFEMALEAEHDRAEIIYEWGLTESDAHYGPHDDEYDEGQVRVFIDDYLRGQGMDPARPAGEVYNREGELFVEYYYDESTQKYSFVLHLWADYWVDDKKRKSTYQDAVYCGTRSMADVERVGSLICAVDETGLIHETQYDAWGMRRAEVSYREQEGFPFPLIVERRNEAEGDFLCRAQKLWFYEESISRDSSGRIVGYQNVEANDWDQKSRFLYPSEFSYDADGRLTAILEEMQQEDIERGRGAWSDYSAEMEFKYDENGTIERAEYVFSQWTHGGTTDSSGDIEYDSEGRMIYNDYYVTHGGDASIYLYKDGKETPWARLDWCSYGPGFERIYLFEPIE